MKREILSRYQCKSCQHKFERVADKTHVEKCPECDERDIGAYVSYSLPQGDELEMKKVGVPYVNFDNCILVERDYTGCHPIIAAALSRNKDIVCRVKSSAGDRWKRTNCTITNYIPNQGYTSTGGVKWRMAEPYHVTECLKGLAELLHEALDLGFLPDSDGVWENGSGQTFKDVLSYSEDSPKELLEAEGIAVYDWMFEVR